MNDFLIYSYCIFNRSTIFMLVLIFVINQLYAQQDGEDNKHVDNQLWIDFYPYIYINENLEYYGDLGYRTILDDYSWHWIYTRPSVRYHFSNLFEGHGGIGFFYVFNDLKSDRLEIRPWQGIKFNWPSFENLKFYHYVRIEERISFLTTNWQASFDFRLRYKLAGNFIFLRSGYETFWYIPFYGEIFIDLFDDIDEIFRNRSRIGMGIGFNPSKEWRFAVLFNWQTSRSGPNEILTVSDNILRLEVRRLWNFETLIKF